MSALRPAEGVKKLRHKLRIRQLQGTRPWRVIAGISRAAAGADLNALELGGHAGDLGISVKNDFGRQAPAVGATGLASITDDGGNEPEALATVRSQQCIKSST